MSGTVPFIALRSCGCVFSESAVRAVIPSLAKAPSQGTKESVEEAKAVVTAKESDKVACPNCGKDLDPTKADAVLPINPSDEVQQYLLENLLLARAANKSSKKRKSAATEGAVTEEKPAKKKERDHLSEVKEKANSPASGNSTPRQTSAKPSNGANGSIRQPHSVKQKLAEQEQKRLEAQANMSEAVRAMFKPRGGPKDETTEFFGRTFNRVCTAVLNALKVRCIFC